MLFFSSFLELTLDASQGRAKQTFYLTGPSLRALFMKLATIVSIASKMIADIKESLCSDGTETCLDVNDTKKVNIRAENKKVIVELENYKDGQFHSNIMLSPKSLKFLINHRQRVLDILDEMSGKKKRDRNLHSITQFQVLDITQNPPTPITDWIYSLAEANSVKNTSSKTVISKRYVGKIKGSLIKCVAHSFLASNYIKQSKETCSIHSAIKVVSPFDISSLYSSIVESFHTKMKLDKGCPKQSADQFRVEALMKTPDNEKALMQLCGYLQMQNSGDIDDEDELMMDIDSASEATSEHGETQGDLNTEGAGVISEIDD